MNEDAFIRTASTHSHHGTSTGEKGGEEAGGRIVDSVDTIYHCLGRRLNHRPKGCVEILGSLGGACAVRVGGFSKRATSKVDFAITIIINFIITRRKPKIANPKEAVGVQNEVTSFDAEVEMWVSRVASATNKADLSQTGIHGIADTNSSKGGQVCIYRCVPARMEKP